jgi:hypothetical protein
MNVAATINLSKTENNGVPLGNRKLAQIKTSKPITSN